MRHIIESLLLAIIIFFIAIYLTTSLPEKVIVIFLSMYVILNNSSFLIINKFFKNKPEVKGMVIMTFGVFKMLFCLALFFILFKKNPELDRKEYILFFSFSYFSFMLLYLYQAKKTFTKIIVYSNLYMRVFSENEDFS